MILKKLLILIIISIVSKGLFAQNDPGRISGTVKDAQTKKPLSEAVITLKSGVLKGQKFALTDAKGQYRINNLPAGNYTIMFEMEGYQKFSQQNIILKQGAALKADYEMAKKGHPKRLEKVVRRQ